MTRILAAVCTRSGFLCLIEESEAESNHSRQQSWRSMVFLFGFEKNDRATIDARELAALQKIAGALLALLYDRP